MVGFNRNGMGLGPTAGSGGVASGDAMTVVTSAVDPTVLDDTTLGYAAGQTIWVNTTDDTVFILADATAGAAGVVIKYNLRTGLFE